MIKNYLRVILANRRMSMNDLAKLAGVSYTTINRFEKDDKAHIHRHTLDTICRVLNVQVGDILRYEPNEKTGTTNEQ